MTRRSTRPWIIGKPKYGIQQVRRREDNLPIGTIQALSRGKGYRAITPSGEERIEILEMFAASFLVNRAIEADQERESKLNARYGEIRNVAYRLMDDACQDGSLFDNQNWINERFELECEYLGICDELKRIDVSYEFETFPGNEE